MSIGFWVGNYQLTSMYDTYLQVYLQWMWLKIASQMMLLLTLKLNVESYWWVTIKRFSVLVLSICLTSVFCWNIFPTLVIMNLELNFTDPDISVGIELVQTAEFALPWRILLLFLLPVHCYQLMPNPMIYSVYNWSNDDYNSLRLAENLVHDKTPKKSILEVL